MMITTSMIFHFTSKAVSLSCQCVLEKSDRDGTQHSGLGAKFRKMIISIGSATSMGQDFCILLFYTFYFFPFVFFFNPVCRHQQEYHASRWRYSPHQQYVDYQRRAKGLPPLLEVAKDLNKYSCIYS